MNLIKRPFIRVSNLRQVFGYRLARVWRWVFLGALLVFVAQVVAIVALAWYMHTYTATLATECFVVGDDRVLSDEDALRYTRKALSKYLDGPSQMKPLPYHGEDNYFARNRVNDNSGYVIWYAFSKGEGMQYGVTISKQGREVHCDVYRQK